MAKTASRVLRTGGLYFNGKDSYVECGYIGSYIMNDFSICMWLNSREWGYVIRNIISNHRGGIDDDYSFQIIWIGSALRFAWSPGTWKSIILNSTPPLNTWFHLTFTFNDTTDEWRYYENGELIRSGTADIDLREPNKKLQIGREIAACYFYGFVDEVRIYSRVLSPSEISEIYSKGTFIKDGLVLYLPFYEGEGNIAHDVSGYGNHGTIYGGAMWVVKKALRVLPKAR